VWVFSVTESFLILQLNDYFLDTLIEYSGR
jgi:hypothetical protein